MGDAPILQPLALAREPQISRGTHTPLELPEPWAMNTEAKAAAILGSKRLV